MRTRTMTGTAMAMVGVALMLSGCDGVTGTSVGVGAPGSLEGLASEALQADLPYLRQEEKLARDVYRTLGESWGTPAMANIANSEQTHTDLVRDLLAALVIPDPVLDDAVGVLAEPALAALYADLVATGRTSEVEALRVGATIEDLDIADLRAMAARTDLPEALAVYSALECGSRNHLRSYVALLAAADATWAPTHLTQAEVDAIVGSPREKCGA